MNLSESKMKNAVLFFVFLLTLTVTGCAGLHHNAEAGKAPAASRKPIITPDLSLSATVVSVDNVGQFVVLNFPAEQLPKVGQTLFLYRNGLKVAQLNVTGPQDGSNIVADIVTGNAQVGDIVRND